MKKSNTDYFLNWGANRIQKNKNLLILLTGQTGSGKTYSSISLAEAYAHLFQTPFTIKDVIFTPKEFMTRINSGELKKGSVLVFDEAGVGYSAREWWSISNKLINYLMQTFRHRNYIVIFTTPDMSFIDKACRRLIHVHMETIKIDYFKRLCVIKPFIAEVNQRTGKTYWKYLRVPGENKIVPDKVERIGVGLPSKEIRIEYEKKKEEYTTALNKSIEEALGDGKSKPLTKTEEKYLAYSKMGLSPPEIADKEKCRIQNVYQIYKKIRDKGHTFD